MHLIKKNSNLEITVFSFNFYKSFHENFVSLFSNLHLAFVLFYALVTPHQLYHLQKCKIFGVGSNAISLGGIQAHTLGTVISFYPQKEMIVKIQNENKNKTRIVNNKNADNNNLLSVNDENINNNLNVINTSPNQFNKGLKRKHSLKAKYEQEKKSTYTKIAQTKQTNKQSQIITSQFNPKHLLLVVRIDR